MSRARRLLIAVDASRDSLAVLEVAADLARRMGAQLSGIYVEDENLVRLAEHPAVRKVPLWSGAGRMVTGRAIHGALVAQAALARRSLSAAAELARVPWTFDVARGFVPHEVVVRAREAELLLIGRSKSRLWRRRGISATMRAVLARTSTPLLVLEPGQRWRSPVAVIFDGSRGGEVALVLAARLLDDDSPKLVVLVPALGDPETSGMLLAAARQAAAELDVTADIVPIATPVYSVVCDAMHARGARALVVHERLRFVDDDALERLVAYLDCPVLITPWKRADEARPSAP
jgi:nucleotide-binding universal stress UspA family protein